MTHFVRHEPCPKCRELGRDRNGNNLGLYSDGSVYCFSCGYTNASKTLHKLKENNKSPDSNPRKTYHLPRDISNEIPDKAREWLQSYSLTNFDILKHNILWSDHEQRIIFPIFGSDGELLAWQGRYMGTENKSKWFSQGDLKNIEHVLGNYERDTLVLVEDLISAIRVSNCNVSASALFGSHISTTKWKRVKQYGFKNVICWLDKDKQIESAMFAKNGRLLGIEARSVITDKDPKEYSDMDIRTILTQTLSA